MTSTIEECWEQEESPAEQGADSGSGDGVGTAVNCVVRTHLPAEGPTDPGAECCGEECEQKWGGCSGQRAVGSHEAGAGVRSVGKGGGSWVEKPREKPLDVLKA